MNLIPHYWEKYNRSLEAYGADDPVTLEHWGEYVMVHKAEHTALHTSPPVETGRVEVLVWEYLRNESERFARLHMSIHVGETSFQRGIMELLKSHSEILSILSQQQKARDENG